MTRKFLRTDWMRYSRLGKNRKKIQRWRRAKGRHNKIRKRREGYPSKPLIGYGAPRKESGKIHGLIPLVVGSFNDLNDAGKHNIIILGRRLGARKKMEIIKRTREMNLKIANLKTEEK